MRLLICGALFIVLLTCSSPEAFACSCRPYSPRQAYEDSRTVFVGEFTGLSIRRKRQPAKLKFKIEKQWKGELPTEAILDYLDIPGSCGDLDFVKGQKYLIYVGVLREELFIWVDCGRSRNVKNAAEDIDYLNNQQSSFKVIPTPTPNKRLERAVSKPPKDQVLCAPLNHSVRSLSPAATSESN